jgi:hypothetical protein
MGKKNKRTKVEAKAATGPTLRWLVCEDGDVHIFGPCPRCFHTSGGMLLGSTLTASRGIARAKCTDCDEGRGHTGTGQRNVCVLAASPGN